MFRKFLSYFVPVIVKKYASQKSGTVEITLVNGKKVLDTATSNYSFGSLQKIMHTALVAAGFDEKVRSVLVLGTGGGSVVQIIRENFRSDAHLTLVEIDETIIEIAKKEFEIERYGNLEIVHADAFRYVETGTQKFDLLIVDLFIIDTVPPQFTDNIFLQNIAQKLTPNGKLIYNTMHETMPPNTLKNLQTQLEKNGLKTLILERVNDTNDLVIGSKT